MTSFGPIKSTFSGLKGPPFGESIRVTFEEAGLGITVHMGVSENGGTPKSSILIGFFHYKPSILGYPYFWKHPYLVEHMKFKLVFCCPKWLSKFFEAMDMSSTSMLLQEVFRPILKVSSTGCGNCEKSESR